MYIAKIMHHMWEEEPISGIAKGKNGTFAIFFYGCNMRCVYCQNSKISHIRIKDILNDETTNSKKILWSPEELSDEMIKAEASNVASISFITGVLYVDEIVLTIKLAKEKGLKIPIVYNSSAYEPVSQIKKLEGLIDIYLPDFKYYDNELGNKYSKVNNYPSVAKKCIAEMYRQVVNSNEEKTTDESTKRLGEPTLIVRHLVLPGHTENSKQVIKYLYDTYGNNICLSIMSQYTPMIKNEGILSFPELTRKLTKREYDKVVNYAISLGVKNAYIQDGDVALESFIPEFA